MSRGQGRGVGVGLGAGEALAAIYARLAREACPLCLCSCWLPGPAAWGGWPELQGQKHQGVLRTSVGSVYVSQEPGRAPPV